MALHIMSVRLSAKYIVSFMLKQFHIKTWKNQAKDLIFVSNQNILLIFLIINNMWAKHFILLLATQQQQQQNL